MRTLCRSCLLAGLLAGCTCAQRPRIGIEAGLSSGSSSEAGAGVCAAYYGSCSSQRVYNHPAALGPVLSFGLPASLSLRMSVLYSRVTHDEASQIRSISSSSSAVASKTSISRWTIPVVVKYRLTHKRAAPFVDGGFAFDVLSNGSVSGNICGYSFVAASPYTCTPLRSPAPDPARRAIFGGVIGGGIEIRLPFGHLSPELRFTRWRGSHFDGVDSPRPNEPQVVLGITF